MFSGYLNAWADGYKLIKIVPGTQKLIKMSSIAGCFETRQCFQSSKGKTNLNLNSKFLYPKFCIRQSFNPLREQNDNTPRLLRSQEFHQLSILNDNFI